MTKTSKGIVLSGLITVGTFNYHTAEDSYGYRNIMNLKLDSKFMNDQLSASVCDLRFLFVEDQGGTTYKVIEDLGPGKISGSGFHDGSQILIKEAVFIKSPKGKSVNNEN